MSFQPAERIQALPPYLFVAIDRKKRAARDAGRDIIDFGVGDPDQPTPAFVIDRLRHAAGNPANHRYPHDQGLPAFRAAAADFLRRRYGVELDPDGEVLALIGTKEGLGHLAIAVVNPGDLVLCPDPGYPVYRSGTIFAGGQPWPLPLVADRGWLPDLEAIPPQVARRAKLMYLNYPNNPTGAVADRAFLEHAVQFARRHGIILAHDAAYSEMCYEEADRAASVLQIDGAREVAIELHSLSKTFNMTGWRLGFAAGNREVLAALARIKSNLDSGQFGAIQEAGCEALAGFERSEVTEARLRYAMRARLLAHGLRELGFRVAEPRATFYVWAGVPDGYDAMGVVNKLLDEADVVCIPGTGFGQGGEGYVRFAVTVGIERIRQALSRMRELRW